MTEPADIIALTTEIVSAYVTKNSIRTDDVPAFIVATHAAIAGLGATPEPEAAASEEPEHTPAVSARKSLASPDHIISMIDGKPYKTLKRHLSTNGMTPAEYRQRYGLKADYPMVAPTYAETRRSLAHKIGLGRKAKVEEPEVAAPPANEAAAPEAEAPAAPKRGRPKKISGAEALAKVRGGRKPKAAGEPAES